MESWEGWRARLAHLRREVDEHLQSADVLASRMEAASNDARACGCGREESMNVRPCATATIAGPADAELEPVATSRSPEVSRALDHLAAHYQTPVRLVDVARAAGCSRERLVRAFRRETGSTIHRHLIRLRLARAAREVGAGDKIEAVMLGVGYRGKRNFYRQFKARFGMTPGRYRLSLRGRGGHERT